MEKSLPVLQGNAGRKVSRRELARTLLSALAVGALPFPFSPLHPIRRHLENETLLEASDDLLSAAAYRPGFLNAGQMASLDRLAEAIVPGSRKARSAEFIDLLLSVDSAEHRQTFTESLSGIEAKSHEIFGKSVTALDASQTSKLLEAASAENSAEYPLFSNLKSWAAGAYYSSEAGMRELGWTGDRVFSTYPSCEHAESHT